MAAPINVARHCKSQGLVTRAAPSAALWRLCEAWRGKHHGLARLERNPPPTISLERNDACHHIRVVCDARAVRWHLVYLSGDLSAGAAPDAPPCGEGVSVTHARAERASLLNTHSSDSQVPAWPTAIVVGLRAIAGAVKQAR